MKERRIKLWRNFLLGKGLNEATQKWTNEAASTHDQMNNWTNEEIKNFRN